MTLTVEQMSSVYNEWSKQSSKVCFGLDEKIKVIDICEEKGVSISKIEDYKQMMMFVLQMGLIDGWLYVMIVEDD